MTNPNARIGVPDHTPSDGSSGVERYKEATRERMDAVTIGAQRALIKSLEGRLKSSMRRIADLEMALGAEKRSLVDEIDRLKLSLREMGEGAKHLTHE